MNKIDKYFLKTSSYILFILGLLGTFILIYGINSVLDFYGNFIKNLYLMINNTFENNHILFENIFRWFDGISFIVVFSFIPAFLILISSVNTINYLKDTKRFKHKAKISIVCNISSIILILIKIIYLLIVLQDPWNETIIVLLFLTFETIIFIILIINTLILYKNLYKKKK